MKKTLVIINPKAGEKSKQNIYKLIATMLDPDLFEVEIKSTEHKGHAKELASSAVKNGIDVVIGVGGDGTINEIANGLVNTNVVLGIVPVGSGNGLARHLTLPLNPKEALKRINRFKLDVIDTAIFNNRVFLCTAGLGFEGEVSKKFESSKRRGFVAYSALVFKSFGKFKSFETLDATQKNLLTFCVANASQYGNNTYIAPKASIQDGLLDLIGLEKFRAINLPHIAWQLFRQTIDQNHMHHHAQCEKSSLNFSRLLPAHVDGEYIGEVDSFEAYVVPKSLYVIV